MKFFALILAVASFSIACASAPPPRSAGPVEPAEPIIHMPAEPVGDVELVFEADEEAAVEAEEAQSEDGFRLEANRAAEGHLEGLPVD